MPFTFTGITLWVRYLLIINIEGSLRGAYVQSVIVGGVALLMGLLLWCLGLIGELLSNNRQLLEESIYIKKRQEYGNAK